MRFGIDGRELKGEVEGDEGYEILSTRHGQIDNGVLIRAMSNLWRPNTKAWV
jgi:hypothetical protein